METATALDVSSHQPRDLGGLVEQFWPEHIVVKGYLPIESIPQDHTRAQVQSARDNGCTVGMYVWCYRSADPVGTIVSILELCESMNLVLPILWLDLETYTDRDGNVIDPGPDAPWLRKAFEACDSVGMKAGIYTGLWWIRGHFPGGELAFSEFAERPIWLSDYDGQANLDTPLPYGFAEVSGKQWTSTPVDRNVFLRKYTVIEEPEPPDACAEIQAEYDHLHAQLEAWRDRRPFRAVTKKQLKALLA